MASMAGIASIFMLIYIVIILAFFGLSCTLMVYGILALRKYLRS